MGSFVVKNNVESLVADNPLAQAATTLNVTAGGGTNFPSTFPFLITLWDDSAFPDPGDDSGMEIVKCTGRTTDALTIVRAQEGTADVAHALGECVAMLITAGIFNDATYGVATKLDGIEASADVTDATNVSAAGALMKSGGTMTDNLYLGDYMLGEVDIIRAFDSVGMRCQDSNGSQKLILSSTVYAFIASAKVDMNSNDVVNVGSIIFNDTELTIATGVVTVSRSYHTIDTEGDAATDDLVTINGGTGGQTLMIRAADGARTVVVKNGTGNLLLGADRTLDNVADTLSLFYDGTNWLETGFVDIDGSGAVMNADKNVANGVAGLDGDADILDSVIPGLANKYLIGDDLLHSHDAERFISNEGEGAKKTITINTLSLSPSTIRIKFDYKCNNISAWGQIYKNGVAIGTKRHDSSDAYVTFSEDLSFGEGDTIELWIYSSIMGIYIRNFRIYGTAAALTLKEAVENSNMGETTPFAATNS